MQGINEMKADISTLKCDIDSFKLQFKQFKAEYRRDMKRMIYDLKPQTKNSIHLNSIQIFLLRKTPNWNLGLIG